MDTMTPTERHKFNVLALVQRYLSVSYQIDPLPKVEAAIAVKQQEYTKAKQSLQGITDRAFYCNKTGQPLGIMFAGVTDKILQSSIAPTWIDTSTDKLRTKLEKDPIGLLVYMIRSNACSDDDWLDKIANTYGYNSIVDSMSHAPLVLNTVYDMIAQQTASNIAKCITIINEFIAFAQYRKNIEEPFENALNKIIADGQPVATIITMIATSYTDRLTGIIKHKEASASRTLDDQALVDYMEKCITIAKRRIVNPNATTPEHAKPPVHTRERKRTVRQRETDLTRAEVAKIWDEELMQGLVKDITPATTGYRPYTPSEQDIAKAKRVRTEYKTPPSPTASTQQRGLAWLIKSPTLKSEGEAQ